MTTKIGAIAVFCGSKVGSDPAYADAARALGRGMADRGIRLVYGGGGLGLMNTVAQAVLDAGGKVTGVIPDFLMRYEVGKKELTDLFVVPSMHDRKRQMFELADGFVVLPGGLGTLDEAIEIITWKQLHLHAKPIVFLSVDDYWKPLQALVDHVIAKDFAHGAVPELFGVVDRPEAVFDALENAPPPKREVLTSHL
jgi:uncharacterized protein (TIGR00730 family)